MPAPFSNLSREQIELMTTFDPERLKVIRRIRNNYEAAMERRRQLQANRAKTQRYHDKFMKAYNAHHSAANAYDNRKAIFDHDTNYDLKEYKLKRLPYVDRYYFNFYLNKVKDTSKQIRNAYTLYHKIKARPSNAIRNFKLNTMQWYIARLKYNRQMYKVRTWQNANYDQRKRLQNPDDAKNPYWRQWRDFKNPKPKRH